jgi:hypothetical protein
MTATTTKQPRNAGQNFRYLQLETNEGTGYACVYLEWQKQNGKISYQAGLAFCSPKDKFVKDLARNMAKNRFEKDRTKRVTGSLSSQDNARTFVTIEESMSLLEDVLREGSNTIVKLRDRSGKFTGEEHSVVPNWARRAIEKKAYKVGLRQEQAEKPGTQPEK